MPVFSLVVKGKSAPEFFTGFKDLECDISGLKAVVSLPVGVEATFVSEAVLKTFLETVEGKGWEVVCDLKTTTIVTLAPRGQGWHAMITDEVVVAFLKTYCTVLDVRRLY